MLLSELASFIIGTSRRLSLQEDKNFRGSPLVEFTIPNLGFLDGPKLSINKGYVYNTVLSVNYSLLFLFFRPKQNTMSRSSCTPPLQRREQVGTLRPPVQESAASKDEEHPRDPGVQAFGEKIVYLLFPCLLLT